MFEQARRRRDKLTSEYDHFYRPLTHTLSESGFRNTHDIFSTSVEKRARIQQNLNRFNDEYCKTGFSRVSFSGRTKRDQQLQGQQQQRSRQNIQESDIVKSPQNSHYPPPNDLSMSLKYSESNFMGIKNAIPKAYKQGQNVESAAGQRELHMSFYEESASKQVPFINKQIVQKPAEALANNISMQSAAGIHKLEYFSPLKESKIVTYPEDPKIQPQKDKENNSRILEPSSKGQIGSSSALKEAVVTRSDPILDKEEHHLLPDGNIPGQKNQQIPNSSQINSSVKNSSLLGMFNNSCFQNYIDSKKQQQPQDEMGSDAKPQSQIVQSQSKNLTPAETERLRPPEAAASNYNNSALKESLNRSLLEEVFNEKIKNELFVNLEDITLASLRKDMFTKRLRGWAEAYTEFHEKKQNQAVYRSIYQFSKFCKLFNARRAGVLYQHFLHFKLFREYKFEKKKKDIAAQRFSEKQQDRRVASIFFALKQIQTDHNSKVKEFLTHSQGNLLKVLWKSWKLYWFQHKIRKQVDAFRLSRLFTGWKKAAQAQKIRSTRKALKFYYKHFLRRTFNLLREGVMNSSIERQQNELALAFFIDRRIRQVFDLWRDVTQELVNLRNNSRFIPVQLVIKDRFLGPQRQNGKGDAYAKRREITLEVPNPR